MTNAAVRRIRRRHRVCHRRRTAVEPRRLSRTRRRRTCSRVRWCSTARPGRSTCATSTSGGPGRPARAGTTRGAAVVVHKSRPPSRRPCRVRRRCSVRGLGRPWRCRPRPNGRPRPAAGSTSATYTWGDEPEAPGQRLANYWHGEFPYLPDTGYGQHRPGRQLPAQRLRAVRHGRQCLGVDHRLVRRHPRRPTLLRRRQLRSAAAAVPSPAQGGQGRLVPVRRQSTACATGPRPAARRWSTPA